MVDRLERLTDLVLFLRQGRPRSLREIADSVPGYPAEGEARRQAFERDKRSLRAGGVEITTVQVPGRDQIGYMIRTEDFYLPALELEADEQAALNIAVAGVHLDDPSGRDALWRLGLPASAGARPVAQLPALPALGKLYAALRSHAGVTFTYRGETRSVDPALLRFRGGWWYLVGFDRDKNAPRTFRVDRIEDEPVSGASGSSRLPAGFDASAELPGVPWKIGKSTEADPVAVDVLVDPLLTQFVIGEVGEATVVERRDDNSAVVRLEVTNTEALRNWLFELGEHAEILSPPAIREEVTDWLESIVFASGAKTISKRGAVARAGAARSKQVAASQTGPIAKAVSEPAETTETSEATEATEANPAVQGCLSEGDTSERPGTGRMEAGRRLQRLLAVLTWLARSGRAPVAELAERFGLSAAELVTDLELAACCGLPPYTPDQLMEIIVDEKEVEANLGGELARPRRLTPTEGFALAASARAILAVPGSDPDGALSRALSKLEDALGDTGALGVELGEPPYLEAARRAALQGEQLELRYYSVSSDEESVRTVDPIDVVAVEGHWYLDGYCHRAEGMRRFRVDRISELVPTGKTVPKRIETTPGPVQPSAAFVPGPDSSLVRLAVDPQGGWLVESVPTISTSALQDGWTEVVLGVSSPVWFERLLLRLGIHARVLDPPDLSDAGSLAAKKLLDRYRGSGRGDPG
jgi:predicted DNA-binding transcriptional regulator YafY